MDANQVSITKGLRKFGASVKPVHTVKGFVDLVVGFKGKNYLLELKDPDQVPSKQKLTVGETKFQQDWVGQVATVKTLEEAIEVIS